MNADPSSAPRARADVVPARIGAQFLLFEPASRRLHALNASAALIWERLDGAATVPAIARRLGERYAADRAVVEADVVAVIDRFQGLGLLEDGRVLAPCRPDAPPLDPPVPDAIAAVRHRLDDRPWAWRSDVHAAPGLTFRVQVEDAAAAGALARALRTFRTAAVDGGSGERPVDLVFTVLLDPARGWSVHAGATPVGAARSIDDLVALVLRQLDRAVVAHLPRALCFHGGAVQIGRQVVLLPGPPGSGTSSVTSALVRRGAGYLADQVAPFDPARGAALAYPRPIGAWRPVDPAAVPGVVLGRGGPIRVVIAPVRVPGAPTRVEHRTDADAVRLLLDATYAFDGLGADGFLALVALARRVPVYRVTSDDLDATCEVVLELARVAS